MQAFFVGTSLYKVRSDTGAVKWSAAIFCRNVFVAYDLASLIVDVSKSSFHFK